MAYQHVTAADLTVQVQIQQRADVANSRGEPVPTWQPVATVWAQRQQLRGREFFAAGQLQAPVEVRFRLAWRAGITAQMRVVHQGVPFDIVGEPIDVDNAHRTLELMCTSGVRDGR